MKQDVFGLLEFVERTLSRPPLVFQQSVISLRYIMKPITLHSSLLGRQMESEA